MADQDSTACAVMVGVRPWWGCLCARVRTGGTPVPRMPVPRWVLVLGVVFVGFGVLGERAWGDEGGLRARGEARPLMPSGAVVGRGESGAPAPATTAAREAPRTIGALVGVLALAGAACFGVRALAKRSGGLLSMLGPGGRAPAGVLEVLGRYPVGRGQTLVLLKLDRRVLLVSQTGGGRFGGGGFTTLCELTDPEDVASILQKTRDEASESMSAKFQQMLHCFERGHEQADPTRIVTRIEPVTPATEAMHTRTGRDAAAALRSRLAALREAEGDVGVGRLGEVRA